MQVVSSRNSHDCGLYTCITLESVGAIGDAEPCMES